MCIIAIRNVSLQCIKITNAQSEHTAYVKIEAVCINLEIGKIYRNNYTRDLETKTRLENKETNHHFY